MNDAGSAGADASGGADGSDVSDLADEPSISDDSLRPTLDLALAVANAGARTRPVVASPDALRAYLRRRHAPAGALAGIRSAVNEDAHFRRRVATIATDSTVGPIGLLWLNRPPGWRRSAVELAAPTITPSTPALVEDKTERRRREAAERNAAQAVSQLSTLRTQLDDEQRRRAAAEQAAHERDEAISQLQRRASESAAAALSARQKLERVQATADRQAGELADLRRALAEAEAGREAALASRAAAETVTGGAEQIDRGVTNAAAVQEGADQQAMELARRSMTSTADELRQLAASLDAAASHWTVRTNGGAPVSGGVDHPFAPSVRRHGHGRRREPLAIPGGLHRDTIAAATHLFSQPGVLVMVDGYNVAMLGWPELTLEQRRSALLVGLDDLVRRLGTRIVVIFDGTSVGAIASSGTGRRLVRTIFSEHGVTADDEIRRLVSMQSSRQSIVVVTNDKAIINDVRPLGVNPVSSDALLGVLRR